MRNRVTGALVIFAFAFACARAPQAPEVAPQWNVIPSGVMTALCQRLQMDAIGAGDVAVVRTTRPLATAHAISSLGLLASKRVSVEHLNAALDGSTRVVPIIIDTTCGWKPVDAADSARLRDVTLVEISPPLINPYARGQAGVFARVSLAGENASWYWIALVPHEGLWTVASVMSVSM